MYYMVEVKNAVHKQHLNVENCTNTELAKLRNDTCVLKALIIATE